MTPILYSIDCPKCKVLQKKLSDARIQYAYCTDREEMVYRGITSLPMLLVNDVLLDFSEALDWISEQSPDEIEEVEEGTCGGDEDEMNDGVVEADEANEESNDETEDGSDEAENTDEEACDEEACDEAGEVEPE